MFYDTLFCPADTLKKFYYPNAFLRLAADYQPYQALYQQIMVAIEPMVHLPFDLSIDFESRAAAEIVESPENKGSMIESHSLTVPPHTEASIEKSSENVS